MPCDSSYMEPVGKEKALSRVACLLDELKGKPIDRREWAGYHPKVYKHGLSDDTADALVSKLYHALQKADVTKYSLEMQIWWRDHQAADKARLERALEACDTAMARAAALAKLTPQDRAVLGLSDK